jgi:predicted Rossmann fold nucleotide-binding protein DprA/Smf involved in DNA uptake
VIFAGLSGDDPRSVDEIVEQTGLPVPVVTGTLFTLELKRIVKQLPGQLYVVR